MKKKNTILIAVITLVVVAGLSAIFFLNRDDNTNVPGHNTNPQTQPEVTPVNETQGYYFEYKGVKIGMNDLSTPVIEALGEPMNYFEAPSCAFEGMDKFYTYSGFEFTTYTEGDKDYIYTIVFLDDSVTTREGIGLNASIEEVTKAYGSDFKQDFGQYTYTDGSCNLRFLLENNEVVSVEYASVGMGDGNEQ